MHWSWPPKKDKVEVIEYEYVKDHLLRRGLKFKPIEDSKGIDYDSIDILEDEIDN